jgi:hypothetical protein
MPSDKFIKIWIDGQEVDVQDATRLPLAITYQKEDPDNFQRKRSSEALSIKLPATLGNGKIANTFHNPSVEDLTNGRAFRKPRTAVIEANGYELLIGKAFLQSASHTDTPESYEWSFYGNNAGWIVDLKEATLYDFLKHISFTFSKPVIEASWAFDGTDEFLPYVFAPVRYGQPFVEWPANFVAINPPRIQDYNVRPEQLRPSISKYWLIYWAFKSVGYRIQSSFFDTPFFRRQVMPWTWGNFLYSEGTKTENLKFLAKGSESVYVNGDNAGQIWDLKVSNDSTNGAYDNNGVYQYNAGPKTMQWTYLTGFNYGNLIASFRVQVSVEASVSQNSSAELRIQWFKNGVAFATGNPGSNSNGDIIVDIDAPAIGRRDDIGIKDFNQEIPVAPGDVITARFFMYTADSALGFARLRAEVIGFGLDFFKIPLGGTISFDNFNALKKYKFLDFLSGVVDEFNLSIETDPVNNVVLIEPGNEYTLPGSPTPQVGYLNGQLIDWNGKQDLSRVSTLQLYSEMEREVIYGYKDDSNDGMLKTIQDRLQVKLGQAKYVLPERFKTGKKEVTNRFFSPVVHYEAEQWKGKGSDPDASPQLIALIPENRSNTSKEEAQNTFAPKSAYYKGLVTNVGWHWDGANQANFPFMFAVNYQPGGQNDPVLSYTDELIGAQVVPGLLKRFYLQRMAVISNGQFYSTYFRLNNTDIGNWFHRELIICKGQPWELVSIKSFSPVAGQSTQVELRKFVDPTQEDLDAVYPTNISIVGDNSGDPFDTKYSKLKCLPADIPKE